MKNSVRRTLAACLLALVASVSWSVMAQATEVTVYKSPTCGCCNAWIKHMEANGFTVRSHNTNDVAQYKVRYGIKPELASCHTALVDGYVIEGHVPAGDIKRLLRERPAVTGLAVPGMPAGSPGMEGPRKDPYRVLSFDSKGQIRVFASH